MRGTGRRGATLLELLVVLAMLGGVASVSGFAVAGWRRGATVVDPVATGRRQAIMTGQSVRLSVVSGSDSTPHAVLMSPDGRVLRESRPR